MHFPAVLFDDSEEVYGGRQAEDVQQLEGTCAGFADRGGEGAALVFVDDDAVDPQVEAGAEDGSEVVGVVDLVEVDEGVLLGFARDGFEVFRLLDLDELEGTALEDDVLVVGVLRVLVERFLAVIKGYARHSLYLYFQSVGLI